LYQRLCLSLWKEPTVLEGYVDANWISDSKKTSKSPSGYVSTLGGAVISWKSTKQIMLARSTIESDFIALDKVAEEAEWLRNFLEDIPMWEKLPAIRIHCDSQSAIARAQSNLYNGKSRHIRRRHKTIRQLISTGVITIDYIKSADNLADPFTKGLPRDVVAKSSKGMGLKPITNEDA